MTCSRGCWRRRSSAGSPGCELIRIFWAWCRGLHPAASRHIRIDRQRARPYDGHGRHRLGSLPATVAKRRRGGIPHVKNRTAKSWPASSGQAEASPKNTAGNPAEMVRKSGRQYPAGHVTEAPACSSRCPHCPGRTGAGYRPTLEIRFARPFFTPPPQIPGRHRDRQREPILRLTPHFSLCSPLPRSSSRRDAVPANATTPRAKANSAVRRSSADSWTASMTTPVDRRPGSNGKLRACSC